MNQFIILLKRKKKEMLLYGSIMTGVYLFGLIMAILICIFAGESTTVTFGTMFALGIAAFAHLFGNIATFLQEFNLAISMGQLRRKFVWCYQAAALLELLAMILLAWLMNLLENTVYRVFLPEITLEINTAVVFRMEYLVPVVFTMMIVEIFVSALILRYGPRAMWGVWGIWMLICLSPRQLLHNERLYRKVQEILTLTASQIEQWGSTFWISSAILLGAVLLGVSWNMLRKQRVTV